MKTETWPLERLIDYARNPRKNDHAVDRVAAAIKEFGFRVPIVAKSDGLVVDGHLRLKAARKLGLAEVPVVLADDLTDAQVKAFRISVNRMAELAEWDSELLALELGELGELGFDLELTGFNEGEIAALSLDDAKPPTKEQESSTKEIDPDDFTLGHRCPRCGFEFDDDK
jgi:ParB-like chromosome segregation protein Spo0J